MGSMKITDQHQYLSHDELIGLMATSGQKYQYLKFFFLLRFSTFVRISSLNTSDVLKVKNQGPSA